MTRLDPTETSFTQVLTPVREPRLFGKKMQFERSTAFGFSPNTLMMAASGLGWAQETERRNIRAYRAILAWVRSQEQGSRMQKGTRTDFEHALHPFEDIGRPMTPVELKHLPNGLASPWRLLFRGIRRKFGSTERKLLVRLALCDRTAHQITDLSDDHERMRRLTRAMLPSFEYWTPTGFDMPWQAFVVLDTILQHLAWLDEQFPTEGRRPWPANTVIGLAEPSKRPMRHWFDGLLAQTKRRNLVAFYNFLGTRSVVSRDRVISHDQLKKWARTQELMPHHAVLAVLKGCKQEVDGDHEHVRLWIARLLTFLLELICSFSAEPVDERAAQTAIHVRLVQLRAGIQAA